MYNVTLRCVRVTIAVVENHCVTYSECLFVALGIQNAMHMRPIILPSVSCSALQYFSTLSNKRHDFLEKNSYST
jgi:hypothetical protein